MVCIEEMTFAGKPSGGLNALDRVQNLDFARIVHEIDSQGRRGKDGIDGVLRSFGGALQLKSSHNVRFGGFRLDLWR